LAPHRRPAPPHTGRSPSADPLPAAAGAEHRLVEQLMPLVRLLAKQAAVELAAGDAEAEEPQ
jgi:hypothetical protein